MDVIICGRQAAIFAAGRRWTVDICRHPATSPQAGLPAMLITRIDRDDGAFEPPTIDPASSILAEAEAAGAPLSAAVRAFRAMEPRHAQEVDWRPLYESACCALGLAPL